MLWIHQYRVHIIYKPVPELYIVDWLAHNHIEKKTKKLQGWPHKKEDVDTEWDNFGQKEASLQWLMALQWKLKDYSFSVAETDATAAAHQSNGNRKDDSKCSILGEYVDIKNTMKQCAT